MLAVKIVLSLLVASAVGEQASSSCGKDVALDDHTVLLQNQVDVKSGTSKSAAEEHMEPQATQGLFGGLSTEATSLVKAGFAEFVAMTLFVFIGCGSACANAGSPGNWQFQVSLTFGFAITALAYGIGHISGGQINCAVTFGLWCSGNIAISQAIFNVLCQLIGSICGALLTWMVFGNTEFAKEEDKTDKTGGLGCNEVNRSGGFDTKRAMVGEIMGTFVLVFTVLETAVNPLTLGNRALACLAIGISVFLSHCVLINVDGCSINPTRSFGPMVVRMMVYPAAKEGEQEGWKSDHWIFWVGPLAGASLAAGVYCLL